MRTALYPGSFDPATIGHLDVIERASRIFDRLIVGVGDNPEKGCLFSLRERLAMMRREAAHLKNVEVKAFRGLVVDFARAEKVCAVLRGIRTLSDLEYEIQMAFANRSSAGVETLFIAPRPEHAFISARFIKEIARAGGRVEGMVSPAVHARLRARLAPPRPLRRAPKYAPAPQQSQRQHAAAQASLRGRAGKARQ
jgi:pantetheine-phosphate adenylyltransferase